MDLSAAGAALVCAPAATVVRESADALFEPSFGRLGSSYEETNR